MKKVLLLFVAMMGFAHEAKAVLPEITDLVTTYRYAKEKGLDCGFFDGTEDEGLLIDESFVSLLCDPNEEKTSAAQQRLLIKQVFSLNFLENRMTQEAKESYAQHFENMRSCLRGNIQLLREEKRVKQQQHELNMHNLFNRE